MMNEAQTLKSAEKKKLKKSKFPALTLCYQAISLLKRKVKKRRKKRV